MRAIGLAAILLGLLSLMIPLYREWVPFIDVSDDDARLMGGLLIAVGALTLAVHRR